MSTDGARPGVETMGGTPATDAPKLTRKDFDPGVDVRWCPGCGDYSILRAVQNVFPELGIPRERFVVVSGIGCSSRFPYYMHTFGFHTIHGRAPAVATGLKLSRPDLSVWVVTGDGDALSIGGNHLIHACRRNVDLKILMFNNRIYGLTKGQFSPTSEVGKKTKSSPMGSVDVPFNPLSVALGAEASFVARTVDVSPQHLQAVLRRAAAHRGTAFVEIYQNCTIFNDGAFDSMTEKANRPSALLDLQHGRPMVFDGGRKGLRLRGLDFEVVTLGSGISESDLCVHDESAESPALAFLLSRLEGPKFPVPIGVLRAASRPTFEEGIHGQIERATERGAGDLDRLLSSGETWTVE